jgi:hypothetical protein
MHCSRGFWTTEETEVDEGLPPPKKPPTPPQAPDASDSGPPDANPYL